MVEGYSAHSHGLTLETPMEGLDVTSERKDSPTVEDIILPVEIIPLSVAIPPFEPPRRQPHALLAQVIPLMGQKTVPTFGGGWGIHQPRLADYGEVALIPREGDGDPDLVVQFVSGNLVAREVIPTENRGALLEIIERDHPDVFRRIHDEMKPDSEGTKVVSGQDGWFDADNYRSQREGYYFLTHLLQQAPSGRIRIESLVKSVGPYGFHPQAFICEQTDEGIIKVRAGIAEYSMIRAGDRIFPVDLTINAEGEIFVDDIEVKRIMAEIKAHKAELSAFALEGVTKKRIRDHIIHSLSLPLWRATFFKNGGVNDISSENGILTRPYAQPFEYAFQGFGQELSGTTHAGHSIRFFDADDPRQTMRTPEEIHRRIFMTEQDIIDREAQKGDIERWWKEDIVPRFREWTPEEVESAGAYIRAHKLESADLIKAKLEGDTRLAVIGMSRHPHFDHLPFGIMEQTPNLDFIAVEVRAPEDKMGALKEDRQGRVSLDVGDGMIHELSHEDAKRLHPGKYIDPNQRDPAWDNVIAEAEARGIHVIYTMKGETWQEMNILGAEEIARYMREHPNARGVSFTSVYGAMKWPGYADENERENIGFNRPLTNDHMFSTNPRSQDASIRMPAYTLADEFPGQVYTMAQFVMPKGYGREWQNFRNAVKASGINDRFAIDGLSEAPFGVERYIFKGMVELEDMPDEDLWELFGTMLSGFFGPVEVEWDKVLDGIIINPSDEPLPPRPTPEQYMRAAAGVIGQIVEDKDKDKDQTIK